MVFATSAQETGLAFIYQVIMNDSKLNKADLSGCIETDNFWLPFLLGCSVNKCRSVDFKEIALLYQCTSIRFCSAIAL